MMRYLGLDLGTKTLGISISDPSGLLATPYKTLKYDDEDTSLLLEELTNIVECNDIKCIVLGYPKNMNNTIGPSAARVIEFKTLLENTLDVEIILEDERMTTKIATDHLIDMNVSRKKRKTVIDKVAANVILQSYLDRK